MNEQEIISKISKLQIDSETAEIIAREYIQLQYTTMIADSVVGIIVLVILCGMILKIVKTVIKSNEF